MPNKINDEFPVQIPMDMYHKFLGLGERGLMTPTYLSSVVMLVVLPALFLVEKNKPLISDGSIDYTLESYFNRSRYDSNYVKFCHTYIKKTHNLIYPSVNGLETLEARNLGEQYEIIFCGNAQDAMDLSSVFDHVKADPSKNYIFWNYPGVGLSEGKSHSVDDLFEAGYQQVKRLIDAGIPPTNITLHGFSLGGGVATHVARQLHEKGFSVDVKIDRSFARLASVVPAQLELHMLGEPSYAPFITSITAFALSGIALGSTFSGFLASVGLVTATAVAVIGYYSALLIQTIGLFVQTVMTFIGEIVAYPFSFLSTSVSDHIKTIFNIIGHSLAYPLNLIGFALNEICSTIASFINSAVNLIVSIVGGAIAIGGLLAGCLVGVVFGMILSIQWLWTNDPFTMPMTPAFSAALCSLCCEMDSVNEIHKLLNVDKSSNLQSNISVTNTMNDRIIDVAASLNTGLGFMPGKQPEAENQLIKEKIKSFWYLRGDHNEKLDELIYSNTSFTP